MTPEPVLGTRGHPVDTGADLHRWATELFPICRSLTGDGVRSTLHYLQRLLPEMEMHEVASGTRALDWTVPDEWNIHDAYVADLAGNRLIDFRTSNLHVVGYSEPVDAVMERHELEPHLYSLADQPDAIPYVTAYYTRTWGFCLTQPHRDQLGSGPFRVVIDSTLAAGSLTYADLVIRGETDEEVLLSTYVCHPSMANNELSGPVVTVALGRWLSSLPRRRYTYRLVFAPETIGAIVYLARHLAHLRGWVRAGWVVTCIGDDRAYSYVPSRLGATLADRVSRSVLDASVPGWVEYSFLDRGSDERQWCSPGADLPVCSVMRSKYGAYPEYHTSLDGLDVVTAAGLQGGLDVLRRCIELIESNRRWRAVTPGEPQLGPRGLYPTTSYKGSATDARMMMNVLAYCDGDHDVIRLAERTGADTTTIVGILEPLARAGVIVPVD
jgi:aminopeptidase-like protein